MKLVIAIIKPFKLEEVKSALQELGVQGLTVTEVKGYGRQKGHKETYRGAEYEVEFSPKVRLEIFCTEDLASRVVDVVVKTANTNKIGDGKVFTLPVEGAVRIRTGETGADAL